MASTGEVWRLGRRPALDGLRGVAVLLVIAHHAGAFPFADAAGVVGVTAFFTLSGYLITSLLLAERDHTGRVDLRSFYARRARRLLPALAAFLAVMVALGLASLSMAGWAALYVANWVGAAGYAATHLGGLTHTWSLALEEQFYLVWPLVLLAAARVSRRAVLFVALSGAACSIIARVLLWDSGAGSDRVYFGGDTRADALLIGCALAVVLARRPARPRRWSLAVPALIALTAVPTLTLQYVVAPTVAALVTAAVIAAGSGGLLEQRWLTHLGRRSYALYLWHFPLIFLVAPRLDVPEPLGIVVAIGLSWLIAEASWHLVERPAIRVSPDSRRTGAPSAQPTG